MMAKKNCKNIIFDEPTKRGWKKPAVATPEVDVEQPERMWMRPGDPCRAYSEAEVRIMGHEDFIEFARVSPVPTTPRSRHFNNEAIDRGTFPSYVSKDGVGHYADSGAPDLAVEDEDQNSVNENKRRTTNGNNSQMQMW